MINTRISLQRMLNQSRDVLTHPQERIFYIYSARSSDSDALTYVAIAAFLTTLFEMLIAGGGSACGLVLSLINELFAFCLFAGVIYFIGQQRGGRGTFQDIAYTFALFYVPIQVLTWAIAWLAILTPIGNVLLPWLWLIQLAGYCAQAFYAHLAVKGVMGFRHRQGCCMF